MHYVNWDMINAKMKAKQYSVTKLAEELGIKTSTLVYWRQKKSGPSTTRFYDNSVFEKLCQILDLNMESVLKRPASMGGIELVNKILSSMKDTTEIEKMLLENADKFKEILKPEELSQLNKHLKSARKILTKAYTEIETNL